jgi:hypothetical protein
MSHFAKVLDGKVIQVIVADQEFFNTFVDTSPGTWLQTSYNTRGGIYYIPNTDTPDPDQSKALRANYAGMGYTYDSVNDVFYAPQPYPSWTISAPTWLWQAPVPYPTDGKTYIWNEATLSWIPAQAPEIVLPTGNSNETVSV